jgi:hypothetical protein
MRNSNSNFTLNTPKALKSTTDPKLDTKKYYTPEYFLRNKVFKV